jgi:capsular polysaccharide transport system permease protein
LGKTPDNPSGDLSEKLDQQASVPNTEDASQDAPVSRRTVAELRAARARMAARRGGSDVAGSEPEGEADPADATVTSLPSRRRPADELVTGFRDVPAVRSAPPPTARRAPLERRYDTQAEPLRLPARRARLSAGFWLSLLLMVVLPTAAGAAYYLYFAADQYVSEFRFAVKSSNASASSATTDLVGAALGQSARLSAFSDNFIVADYITSREAVGDLLKTVDLRAIYSSQSADYLSRLDPTVPIEKLVAYWQNRVDASFDVSTGISIVQVRAFTPEDSLRVAKALIASSESLVNRIAERAREDAVRFAERDVKNAEDRLREVTAKLRQFRNVQQTPDLSTSASGTLGLSLQLRTNLAQMEAQLTSLSTHMAPDAPTIKVLKNNIAATRDQLGKIEGELGAGAAPTGNPNSEGYAATLSDYEDIRLEMQFAQQSYQNMLTALDQVRSSAMSDRTYLMPYVEPSLAEFPLYPERVEDVFIVFLIAGVAWAITMLTVYAVRDHMI